jgi:hypothetical protein
MSYKVRVTTVKPANAAWFSDANPAGHAAWASWFKSLPGLLSVSKTKLNANSIIRNYVFRDEAAYLEIKGLSSTNANSVARIRHNESNGITNTVELLGE